MKIHTSAKARAEVKKIRAARAALQQLADKKEGKTFYVDACFNGFAVSGYHCTDGDLHLPGGLYYSSPRLTTSTTV